MARDSPTSPTASEIYWREFKNNDPHRRMFRGPPLGRGRRGSFERHMLEALFIKAFVLAAWGGKPRSRSQTLKHDQHQLDYYQLSSQDRYVYEKFTSRPGKGDLDGDDIIRKIQKPRWRGGVPREHLEIICEEEKKHLFEGYFPVPDEKLKIAVHIMSQLKRLSPSAASRFAMKAASREALKFRLLFPTASSRSKPRNARSRKIDGYYALSYRWQSSPDRPNPRVTNCKKYTVGIPPEKYIAAPVSDEMLEAIMEELPEPEQGEYGLWCDQICIDESNDLERNTAVSMMDGIYRAAEKVIIALDDVRVDAEEIQALRQFSVWHDYHTSNGRVPEDEDLDYMKEKPRLRSCVEKIIYSEYFDRAWCAHEFELARDRVVLVRSTELSSDGRLSVVRIEDAKLHSLMLLLTLLKDQVLTAEQAARRVNVELLASRFDREEISKEARMIHDMQTITLIKSMKAGGDPSLPESRRQYSAVRDKMSIMLNASDIALVPAADLGIDDLPINLAYSRIYEYISLLMLAAGNPLVLSTTSRSMPVDEEHDSWLRLFWLLDAGMDLELPPLWETSSSPSIPLRVDTAPGCRWIELDMLFPTSGDGILHTASDKFLAMAEHFYQDFRDAADTASSNNSASDSFASTHPLAVVGSRREYITQLIACVLECRWTWGYGPIPADVTTPSPVSNTTSPTACFPRRRKSKLIMKHGSEKPWRYFFGGDSDLDRFPESIESWNMHATNGHRYEHGQGVDGGDEQEQKTARDMASELMSGLLTTAPMPETRGDVAAWRPAWFEIGGECDDDAREGGDVEETRQRCRYIAMVPRDGGTYRAAIPAVLKGKRYSALARCWVLEEREGQDSWVVRNRSKLIMERDSLEMEYACGMWENRERQKVWGRTRGASSDDEVL